MSLSFKTGESLEQVIWYMRQASYPRSENRALINSLFNGAPPFSLKELDDSGASTNVNDLSASVIDHAARRQVWNALCVPTPIFSIDNLDYGPTYKKREWASTITKKINRPLLASPDFLDLRDGIGAQMILHGIGPSVWQNDYSWCPVEVGIEDVLIPANTLRSLKNLPFFAVFRQYTGPMLWKMTHGPSVDPAWNMPLVDKCLDWIDQQSKTLLSGNWPNVWSPEKQEERWKEDSGCYANDAVPTVDCYDFFFWNDDGKESGWNRRMILDSWGQPGPGMNAQEMSPTSRKFDYSKGKFLYDSGDRVYSDKLSKIIHFQFGDASAVAPFRYHTVRSLGFLLYAVCHLQNRLKCRFSDSVFESMMQYFRINNPADVDRLSKVDLIDKGFLPEGLQFVPPEQRWKTDQGLVSEAFQMNRQTMADMSSSFRQDFDEGQGGAEETATRTMAKVNSAAALVGSMLNRIYAYENFRHVEIARRFCIRDSKDPDVKRFRVECLREGVPEEALDSERWQIKTTRVIGGGDRTIQLAMAQALMQSRPAHGPEAQTKILRLNDAIVTDDWEMAIDLNPEQPHVTDSIHDTQLAFGALIMGSMVTPKPGLNAIEVSTTMIQLMGAKVQMIMQMGGVGTPQDVIGLQMCAQYAGAFIQELAMDPEQKGLVKELGDALGKIGNMVKAMSQRQEEMAQQAQQQNGAGADPADAAKAQAQVILAQNKAQLATQSHAQKTAQKQISFEQKQAQDAQKHQAQLQQEAQQHAADLAKTSLEAQQELSIRQQEAQVRKGPDENT